MRLLTYRNSVNGADEKISNTITENQTLAVTLQNHNKMADQNNSSGPHEAIKVATLTDGRNELCYLSH
jgi:hypothetical protein